MKIFDLCGTLYDENTTYGLLKYVRPIYYSIFFSFISRVFFGVLLRLTGCDLLRSVAIYGFKGISKVKVYEFAESYYLDVLRFKQKDAVHKILRSQDGRVAIASASIDPVVNVVANNIGIAEYYSSELEYADGICTGRLKADLSGKKARLFNSPIELVVTDNSSDLELVKNSLRAYLILGEASREFWESNARPQDTILGI